LIRVSSLRRVREIRRAVLFGFSIRVHTFVDRRSVLVGRAEHSPSL
jgi:hypothetical protein